MSANPASSDQSHGTLYVVATPIGNLKDITYRALEILKSVDLILCEDTRESQTILNHYGVATPTSSYHAHNEHKKSLQIIDLLKHGKNIALISDAGTPLINDPGQHLVDLAHQNRIVVSPIVGACSPIAALSVAGTTEQFIYLGFIPAKKNQSEQFLESVLDSEITSIALVGKSKLMKALTFICQKKPNQELLLAKEMTKLHEAIIRDTAKNILSWLNIEPSRQKGEFVLITLHNKVGETESTIKDKQSRQLQSILSTLIMEGVKVSQSAKIASKITGFPKNICYKTAQEITQQMIQK